MMIRSMRSMSIHTRMFTPLAKQEHILSPNLSHTDVLTGEHNVTCLLWSIDDGPFPDEPKTAKWASCSMLLRPVPDTPENYVRVGLLLIWKHENEEERHDRKGLIWQEWYQDSEERHDCKGLSWQEWYIPGFRGTPACYHLRSL